MRFVPLALGLAWLTAFPAAALTIDNGLAPPNPDNVVTGNPPGDGDLLVRDGGCAAQVFPFEPCPNPGAPTTVEVQGGSFEFNVRDRSTLILTGGNHDGGTLRDDAVLHALVGARNTDIINASGNTQILWDGATSADRGIGLFMTGSSSLMMRSGNIDSLFMRDDTIAFFSGGNTEDLGARLSGNARLFFSGGEIGFSPNAGSIMSANDDAFISWTGGRVLAFIEAQGNGVIRISGSDFAVDGVPVGLGPISAIGGLLTGTVADGTAIDNAFLRFSDGNTFGTILLVPEPATGWLVGLGLAALGGRRRPLRTR